MSEKLQSLKKVLLKRWKAIYEQGKLGGAKS